MSSSAAASDAEREDDIPTNVSGSESKSKSKEREREVHIPTSVNRSGSKVQEVDVPTNVSGYESMEDTTKNFSDKGTSLLQSDTSMQSRNSVLQEFDRSICKLTDNISLYRDLGVKEECTKRERALSGSLDGFYLKTTEIKHILNQILDNEDLTSKNKEGLTILRDKLVEFDESLGEITRVAIRYGSLKAEAASLDDMCEIVKSIDKLWRLYTDMLKQTESLDNAGKPGDYISRNLSELLNENRVEARRQRGRSRFRLQVVAFLICFVVAVFAVIKMRMYREDTGSAGSSPAQKGTDTPCCSTWFSLRDYCRNFG